MHGAPKRHPKEEKPKSRYETLPEGDPTRSLPEANGYLIKCFTLAGICSRGGMGLSPLTWGEVEAFSRLSAYPLTGWEAEQLINMSRSYCSMTIPAKELHCPAPYLGDLDKEAALQTMREKVAKQWETFSSDLKVKKRA